MEHITIQPKKVRGHGNVLNPKTCKNFSTYKCELTYENEVFTLSHGNYILELTMSTNHSNFENITLKAILKRVNETRVSGESITIYEEDTEIASGVTDNNGMFTCSISDLEIGRHVFIGVCDNLHVSSNFVNVVVTEDISLSLSSNSNHIFEGSNINLTGALSRGEGYSVKLYQDNTLIDTIITGENGIFTKTISNLNGGNHIFRAVYNGDSTHKSVVSNSVNVNVEYLPELSLNIDGDYTGNSLDKLTLTGNITQNNIGSRGKVLQIYRNTTNGWGYVNTVNSDNSGNYSFTDYSVVSFIDNTTPGTRDELQSLINNAISNGDSEITLTRKYVFTNGDTAISIPDTIQINGNGHIIDGGNCSQIFNITGDDVTLDNFILINGNKNGNGAGIDWSGDNGIITKSTIANCIANNDGGAIYWTGTAGTIENCKFINNAVNGSGGALYLDSDNFSLYNAIFYGNFCNGTGAAILACGDYSTFDNTFIERNNANGINTTSKSIVKLNGDYTKFTHSNVISNSFNENYYDKTTKPVNGEFKYKVRPSPAWIETCDDYAVEKTYYPINLSLSGNDINVGGTLVLTGALGNLSGKSIKIYQDATLIDTVSTGNDGTFSKQITGLNEGHYTFYAVFEGDNTYDSTISGIVHVNVDNSTIIINVKEIEYIGTDKPLNH